MPRPLKTGFKSQFDFWLRLVASIITVIFTLDTVVWAEPNISLGSPKNPAVERGVSISSLYDLSIPDSIGTVQNKFFPYINFYILGNMAIQAAFFEIRCNFLASWAFLYCCIAMAIVLNYAWF